MASRGRAGLRPAPEGRPARWSGRLQPQPRSSHSTRPRHPRLCPTQSEVNSMRDGNPKHHHAARGKTTRTYHSWCAMRQRCGNPNSSKFKNYGGRGIMVCSRWSDSFEAFLEDMGEAPPGHTLDRINNGGNYEPGNCRWATPKQQAANRRQSMNANKLKSHCPSGHLYAGSNLRITPQGDRLRSLAIRRKLQAETGRSYVPHV